MGNSENHDQHNSNSNSRQENTNENSSAGRQSDSTEQEADGQRLARNAQPNHLLSGRVSHPSVPEMDESTNCPVCLTRVSDRAHTDSCMHVFCRECIGEWSRNHNRCPVCREPYSRILFNIRSSDDYDEEPVAVPLSERGFFVTYGNVGFLMTPPNSGIYLVNPIATPNGVNYSLLFLGQNQSFIINNMSPNMLLVRPDQLGEAIQLMEQLSASHYFHGRHPNFFHHHHHI